MEKKQPVAPLPEAVVGARGDIETGRWTVTAGSSQRGDASTDFANRRMVAPVLSDETARLIRNHELTHARISPANDFSIEWAIAQGATERLVHCAEELRVNTVLKGMGYDIGLLSDGTEKKSGERVAQDGSIEAWNEAVAFSVALIGSNKAYNAFIAGVRKYNKAWADELKEIKKEVGYFLPTNPRVLGSTAPLAATYTNAEGEEVSGIIPEGFHYTSRITKEVARHFRVPEAKVKSGDPKSGTTKIVTKTAEERYSLGYGAEVFAPLVWLDLDRPRSVPGYSRTKTRAQAYGKTLRYPDRHLTDPYRRVFGHKKRVAGGIVVIDQSGSMDISEEVLDKVLDLVPSALVVGYSHRPNSTDGTPNAWVLAKDGKRCSSIPNGNIGNGVDGPVLDWVISQRRGNEPIVWVCDGQVTAANDKGYDSLTQAVAHTLVRHKIIQVRHLEDAPKALRSPGSYLGKYYGRVGRYTSEILRRRTTPR